MTTTTWKVPVVSLLHAIDEVGNRVEITAGKSVAFVIYSDGSGRVVIESIDGSQESVYSFENLDELGAWLILKDSARPAFEASARARQDASDSELLPLAHAAVSVH